jgi:hypothetical protein
MTSMCRPYGGDPRRIRRGGQPVEDCGTDFATSDGVIAGSSVAGNQEHDALTGSDRLLQRVIDCAPRPIEISAVKVQNPIRLNRARAEPAIPTGIEGFGR